ncbi:ATP-binding protein [Myxococcota bacterium]
MTLRIKLVVIVLLVATVPLLISAFTGLKLHQRALDDSTTKLQYKVAEHGATLASSFFDTVERTLSLVTSSIQWPALSDAERTGALWLVYRQLPDISAVALLDENGEGLGSSVYRDASSVAHDLQNHPMATMGLLNAFAERIPFTQAKQRGFAVGEAFADGDVDQPFLPVAVRVRGADGAPWVVAANLSFGSLCAKLSATTPKGSKLYLVDHSHRATCLGKGAATFQPAHDLLRLGGIPEQQRLVRLDTGNGGEKVAALSPAKSGWSAVVEQPVAIAFAASHKMRIQTIFWIVLSFVVALAAGLVLTQGISRPVAALVRGALELAKGNFGYRIALLGRDEFGRLSETFNHMGGEIEKRDGEIRSWNKELQQRVEDRTQELNEAQAQLLQSQKIAAVTSLGAGIAHEVNNPLAGVIGLVQVVRAKLKKEDGKEEMVQILDSVEKEGLRIKSIIRTLLTFSQSYGGEGFARLDLHAVIDDCIKLLDSQTEKERIVIRREYARELPPVLGNRTQLQQVFLNLLNNSRIAMTEGGCLTLTTSVLDDQAVRIAVNDTGKGIAPEHIGKIFEPFFTTKDNWRGEGLGLTLAFRIVEQHHGKIKAKSDLGSGTTMTVTLPAAGNKPHLV